MLIMTHEALEALPDPEPDGVREEEDAHADDDLRGEGGALPDREPDGVSEEEGFTLPANGVVVDDLVRSLLVQALERVAGNQRQAGLLLGMNRDQVRYRMGKYQIAGGRGWPRKRGQSGPSAVSGTARSCGLGGAPTCAHGDRS